MDQPSGKISRGDALKGLVVLPALAAALAGTGALAEAKSPPAALKYQNHPKGGSKCSGCRFFLANKKNPKANGGCTLVSGPISPNGWCVAWAKK